MSAEINAWHQTRRKDIDVLKRGRQIIETLIAVGFVAGVGELGFKTELDWRRIFDVLARLRK